MNILGTDYKLVENDITLREINADGECQKYSKVIRIRPLNDMCMSDDSNEVKQKRYNEVLRHEVIHAFFVESGLDEYCDDEELVSWIAMQFPKMYNLFYKYGCVE